MGSKSQAWQDRLRGLISWWWGSLYARVVVTTIILGSAVMITAGALIYSSVATGLVDARIRASQRIALTQQRIMQDTFDAADKTDQTSLSQLARDSVRRISAPSQAETRPVILQRAVDNNRSAIPRVATEELGTYDISRDLATALSRDPEHQQSKVVTVPLEGTGITPVAVIGSRVEIPGMGPYDLYMFFPLTDELETLGIVRTSLIFGGVVLVLLLGGLSWITTRMVVLPVQDAAQVSERLALGELDERLEVRGTDDLARLAVSFNAMADSLQRQIRQLEGLSQLQLRFTSDVSHELRTPLTTIRMATDLIHDGRGNLDPMMARSAELLNNELTRFEMLLEDLLEISRFDAHAATLDVEQINWHRLISEVFDMHAALAEKLQVTLVEDNPDDVVSTADRIRVERILRNLVANAIEHGQGRPVEVSVRANETAVALSVRDYGVGLSPEQVPHVFERFWRADPARVRTSGGTGLGLSIALEDANLHGGIVEAWGEIGKGSVFRLTLPLQPGKPRGESPGILDPALSSGRNPSEIEGIPTSLNSGGGSRETDADGVAEDTAGFADGRP